MKLAKAIEILQDLDTTLPQFPPDDRREAVKLGSEALKRLQRYRMWPPIAVETLLPGETPTDVSP